MVRSILAKKELPLIPQKKFDIIRVHVPLSKPFE